MFRDPQWSENDSPEARAVLEGWVDIQARARAAGGEWDSLVANARRFPFDLAQKVVRHFEVLVKNRWGVTHPGKLAWTALTDPSFTFSRIANEAPAPTVSSAASAPSRPLAFEEERRKREALRKILVRLPMPAQVALVDRSMNVARERLGAAASQQRVSLLAVDVRNDILAQEHADELAKLLSAS